MNRDNDDIDRLLQANVEEQLDRLDWDRFSEDVAKRLATVTLRRRSRIRYLGPLAVAAGFVLVAGLLVTIVARRGERTTTTTVVFDSERHSRCEVTLIDSEAMQTDEPKPSSWCIVVRHESSADESGYDVRVVQPH